MSGKDRDVWESLTSQQQRCLSLLYEYDQGLEAEHRERGARGRYDRVPARVWRRITLAPLGVVGMFELADLPWRLLLAQLKDRGLIEYVRVQRDQGVLVTRAGRAAVRSGLGRKADDA